MAAKHEEERAFVSRAGSPIMEDEREGLEMENEYTESGCGCGCFRLFSLGWGHRRATNGAGEDNIDLLDERDRRAEHKETWVGNTLKRVKEASELVAGPKWKNFIRKIGKYFRNNKKKKNRSPQFHYSPCSYALNFDNGVDEDDQEEGFVPGYSSRFAPPVSTDHQQQRPGLGLN